MKYLQKVNPEHNFILKNGFVVSSLPELHETLQQVDDEIISHHLNEHKNDFARWIEHAVGDDILKNRIEDITSKDRFLEELERRISELQPGVDIALDVPLDGEMLDTQATEPLRNMGLSMDEAPPDVPPDIPPDTPPPTQKKPEAQQPAQDAPPDTPPQEGGQPAAADPAPSTPPPEKPADAPTDTPPSTASQETNQPASDAASNEGKQQPAQDTPSQDAPAKNDEKPKGETDTGKEDQPQSDAPPDTPPQDTSKDKGPAPRDKQTDAQTKNPPQQADTPPQQEGKPAHDNAAKKGGQQPAQKTEAKEDKNDKQPAQEPAPDTPPQEKKKAEDKPEQTKPAKNGTASDKTQEGTQAEAQKEDASPDKKADQEETTASEEDADKKQQEDKPKTAKKESQSPETAKKEDKSAMAKKMVADREGSTDQANDDIVEIRELTLTRLGVPEIDQIFKRGIPNICNLLFVGTMSTGKTLTALQAILSMAKQGKRAMYISFHDSEEKIINVMHSIDSDILNYINAENISVQKLDPFTMGHTCTKEDFDSNEFLQFVEIFSPNLIVVDSLSALELGFPEHKLCYRKFVDDMFKYFEKLGVVAIFIKDLKSKEEVHQEFFENIIADVIVEFDRKKGEKSIKLVKDYPIPQPKKQKKGILSFLRK